ncbi:hypothetical protein MHYP_G00259740 [Metynnis hypsauchen]
MQTKTENCSKSCSRSREDGRSRGKSHAFQTERSGRFRLVVSSPHSAAQRFRVRAPAAGDRVTVGPYNVKDEFRRITAANLERTSLTKLDFYTPNLLTVFEMKGGAAGTKTRRRLDSLGQEGRRYAVIRCLIHFLGESCEELIKDYQDLSKSLIKDSFVDLVMKIIVLASAAAEEGAAPDSMIIVIEGTETGEQINVSGRPRTGECNRFERHHHRVKDRHALQNHLRVREDQQQTVEMILPCECRRTDLLRSAESSQISRIFSEAKCRETVPAHAQFRPRDSASSLLIVFDLFHKRSLKLIRAAYHDEAGAETQLKRETERSVNVFSSLRMFLRVGGEEDQEGNRSHD